MTPNWIDVREYPEFAAAHIEGSTLVPLATLERTCAAWDPARPLTLICRSGRRATQAQQILAVRGFTAVSVLPGGIDAWAAEGKHLRSLARKPWSLERQVRIVAGSLVLFFLALGYLVSPWLLLGAAFVGAGLVFAGVSDICMMATLLGRMPWNRATTARC